MRKVYCALCGNEIKTRESLLQARGIPINEKITVEIGIQLRGQGELCNKCRNDIINRGEQMVIAIKEELDFSQLERK